MTGKLLTNVNVIWVTVVFIILQINVFCAADCPLPYSDKLQHKDLLTKFVSGSATEGSKAKLSCAKRHYLDGPNTIECTNNKWVANSDDTYLRCAAIKCDNPHKIKLENGRINTFVLPGLNRSSGHYLQDSVYWVTCDKGFILKHNPVRRCMWNGTHGIWSQPADIYGEKILQGGDSPPTCEEDPKYINYSCLDPHKLIIENGKINTFNISDHSSKDYLKDSIYWVTCDEGFILKGNPVRRCMWDGTGIWSQPADIYGEKLLEGGDSPPVCVPDQNFTNCSETVFCNNSKQDEKNPCIVVETVMWISFACHLIGIIGTAGVTCSTNFFANVTVKDIFNKNCKDCPCAPQQFWLLSSFIYFLLPFIYLVAAVVALCKENNSDGSGDANERLMKEVPTNSQQQKLPNGHESTTVNYEDLNGKVKDRNNTLVTKIADLINTYGDSAKVFQPLVTINQQNNGARNLNTPGTSSQTSEAKSEEPPIDQLSDKHEMLCDQIGQLLDKYKSLQDQNTSLQDQNTSLQDQNTSLNDQHNVLNEQVAKSTKDLVTKIAGLVNGDDDLGVVFQPLITVDQTLPAKGGSKRDSMWISTQTSITKPEKPSIDQLHDKHNMLCDQIGQLLDKYKSLKDQPNWKEHYEALNRQVTERNNELVTKIKDLVSKYDVPEIDFQPLINPNQTPQAASASNQDTMQTQGPQTGSMPIDQLKQTHGVLVHQIEQMFKNLEGTNEQINNELMQKINDLVLKYDELSGKLKPLETADDTQQAVGESNQNTAGDAQGTMSQTLFLQIDKLKVKHRLLSGQIERLIEKYKYQIMQPNKEDELRQDIEKLTTEKVKLATENEDITKKLTETTHEFKIRQQNENKMAEERLQKANSRIEELEGKCSKLELEKQSMVQNQELMKENIGLKEKLGTSDVKGENRELKKDNKSMRDTMERIKHQLESVVDDMNKLVGKLQITPEESREDIVAKVKQIAKEIEQLFSITVKSINSHAIDPYIETTASPPDGMAIAGRS